MNKKSKLLCVSLLCSLFFISSLNVANAAPPSWVGVSTGDTYTWSITVNVETVLTLIDDLGFSDDIPPDITTAFDDQQEVKIKVRVLDVSDQMTYMSINYVNVSCSLTLILPGTTTVEDVAEFGNLIVEFDPLNYTQELFEVLGQNEEESQSIAGLFMPTDVNWVSFITNVNFLMAFIPDIPSGITISALANGANIVFPATTIDLSILGLGNLTLDTIEVTVTYNDDGVLNTVDVEYGSAILFTLELEASTSSFGDEIPSFELPIIFITTIVVSIGIIYYVKKKKHIIF